MKRRLEVDLPGFSILSSCAVFAVMLLLCTYAATCALTGNYARGIPYASATGLSNMASFYAECH